MRKIPKEDHYHEPSFSQNEKVLLLPDTIDSRIYDIAANTIKEFDDFSSGDLNGDGSLIAATLSYRGDGAQIFDARTGKPQTWLIGRPGAIKSLIFNRDGSRFVSGSADRIVRVWNTQTKRIVRSFAGHTDEVQALELSADEKTLTSASENEIIVWNFESDAKISETKGDNRFSDWQSEYTSPSGNLALIEEHDKPFRLVNAKTNETIKEFVNVDQLDNMIFTPDETRFLLKPWWSGWQLWDVETGEIVREFNVGYSPYNRVAFHPNGKTFVTGGENQNLLMFDLESGEMLWSLFPIDEQEFAQQKAGEAERVGILKRRAKYAERSDVDNQERAKKISAEFSHYGEAESFWNQRLAESGARNKSKLVLPKAKATAAWFALMNNSDLPVSIDTNSMIFNPKCKGLCDGAEISARYVIESKTGETGFNGFDMYSKTVLPAKTTVYFSVALEHFADAKAIYLGFTFQKDNPDEDSDDYGTEQKLFVRESDLPQ